MSRALLTLYGEADRLRAIRAVQAAPSMTRVEFKPAKRSLPQNDKLWAMLTDVARQVEWHGQKLLPEDWKVMFTASLRKARVVPNLEGDGFVILGMSTSSMSKGEFSDLLELIHAFAAERGVVLGGEQPAEAA